MSGAFQKCVVVPIGLIDQAMLTDNDAEGVWSIERYNMNVLDVRQKDVADQQDVCREMIDRRKIIMGIWPLRYE